MAEATNNQTFLCSMSYNMIGVPFIGGGKGTWTGGGIPGSRFVRWFWWNTHLISLHRYITNVYSDDKKVWFIHMQLNQYNKLNGFSLFYIFAKTQNCTLATISKTWQMSFIHSFISFSTKIHKCSLETPLLSHKIPIPSKPDVIIMSCDKLIISTIHRSDTSYVNKWFYTNLRGAMQRRN